MPPFGNAGRREVAGYAEETDGASRFNCSRIIEREGERLRIGIMDADLLDNGTRHPNLALLKISGYCKHYGHTVRLIQSYDEVVMWQRCNKVEHLVY